MFTVLVTVYVIFVPWVFEQYGIILEQLLRQKVVIITTRTVSTQGMCTYRRKLANPRFEWIAPRGEDGVWVD